MSSDMSYSANEPSLAVRAVDIFRRHKLAVVLVFAAVLASAASFALFLPDLYRASAIVLVERPVPETYVRSAVGGELESRLHVIKQEILSRTRLTELVERFNLYPDLRAKEPMDNVLDQMRRDIDIELTGPEQVAGRKTTVSFKLTYTGAKDSTVADVANAVANFYVQQNDHIRSQEVTRLTEFLKAQLESTKKQLDRDEDSMRQYTSKHPGELPQQVEVNLAQLDRLNTQLRLNGERQIKILEDREKLTDGALTALENKAVASGDHIAATATPDERIEALKHDLEVLESRGFTSRHPDVVRLKTEISTLERDRQQVLVQRRENGDDKPAAGAAAAAATSGTSGAAPDASTGTIGSSIAARHRAVDTLNLELNKLKADEAALRQSIATVEKRLEGVPERQQEFGRITRDYTGTKDLYDSLLKRYDDAQVAESMENDKQGERFRILENALPPSGPIAPDRPRLMMLGLIAAFVAAVAAALAAEQFDSTFHTVEDLRSFTQVPVLATICEIRPGRTRRAFRFVLATASVLAVIAVVAVLSAHAARGNEQIVWLLARGA
jgi:polysaccharide chain length determinant protein (PEP-CTERM system associated)